MFMVWFASLGGVAVTGQKKELDTQNIIQHNQWVDQFVALHTQLEADKEKEETRKRFPRRDQASQEIESAKKLRLLEKNERHAVFQIEKDKETHSLSVLDCLALTFGKPSWFELMLWFRTYMTDKDTVCWIVRPTWRCESSSTKL